MKQIVILNFASGKVYICTFDGGEASEFFNTSVAKDLSLREEDCQYMVVEGMGDLHFI